MLKFRNYNQDQGLALRPSLEELIKDRHSVRVISAALDSELNIEKSLKSGAIDYIHKPFEPEIILEKIKENFCKV